MPIHNHFRHQEYGSAPAEDAVEYLTPPCPPDPASAAWRQGMAAVGAALREQRVAAIYLMHGTFVGDDLLGFVRMLERVWASLGRDLRRYEKRLADWIVGDSGNYTAAYAEQFEREINVTSSGESLPREQRIPVRMMTWSSENHHLGRADGAVRLLGELARCPRPADSRVLIWGHSHGGNVLALLSNLLGGSAEDRDRFFQAAAPYYESSLVAAEQREPWRFAKTLLAGERNPLGSLALDLVTMGTPIRYGWDAGGYARLMHFIYHRPIEGLCPYQARFPFSLRSARAGKRGDYIQQIGIAGTNFPPSLLQWPARRADSELNQILQPGLRSCDLFQRLRIGPRVPDEGHTLLIDYCEAGRMLRSAMGHAIYTRQRWLLFHAAAIASRWYGLPPNAVAS